MKKIIFATNNAHKLEEVRHYLQDIYEVVSLKEIGFNEEIDEPYETLQENALAKSKTIYNKYGLDCFADDTGLEVEALDGAPGVYSARYAGPDCSFDDNVNKLLQELSGKENRKAQFRTVVSLILNGKEFFFEGKVKGHISKKRSGKVGFGYDPIFVPDAYHISFAEMDLNEKNRISHRGKAMASLLQFLRS